jgi:flagellar FliL protein
MARKPQPVRAEAEGAPPAKPGGSKRTLVTVILAALVMAGAAKVLLLTPESSASPCATTASTSAAASGVGSTAIPPDAAPGSPPASDPACAPALGSVLKLDPVTVNLADGRYLRLGLALQLTEGADPKLLTEETGGGSRALDAAVTLFGAKSYDELVAPESRAAAKAELSRRVAADSAGTVTGVYVTEFVMQ